MPKNLPEKILQRIVRLSADGNSQREVARMLGVSQGCISKILQRNLRDNAPPHRARDMAAFLDQHDVDVMD